MKHVRNIVRVISKRQRLLSELKRKNKGIFWSYKSDAINENISDSFLAEKVLLHGNNRQIVELKRISSIKDVKGVFDQQLAHNVKYQRRVNQIAKRVFHIHNPEVYIKQKKQERLKEFLAQ